MDRRELLKRIVCDKDTMHGEPCIRGTRVPVSLIAGSLSEMSAEQILRKYPRLSTDDIRDALVFASEAACNTLVA